MLNINPNQYLFEIKKPRKDERRRELLARLSEILGRNKRGLHFITQIWTEEMLEDSIRYCEHYSTIKARNYFFNEYRDKTIIK